MLQLRFFAFSLPTSVTSFTSLILVISALGLPFSVHAAPAAGDSDDATADVASDSKSTVSTEPIIPNPVERPIQPLSPAAIPAATPMVPPPAPSPTPLPRGSFEKQAEEQKKNCERHYTGVIQSELRLSCASATTDYMKIGKNLAQTRCRLSYGEEPRLVLSCLIGVGIFEDQLNGKDDFKSKLQLCAEHYPAHTEIDAFLQESCLIGTHLPSLMQTSGRPHFELCATINPERAFIGPCSVGLSLVTDTAAATQTGQQNKVCEQYFDHRQFHIGYRSCLSARGLGPQVPERLTDALKACSNVIANAENDTERAACMVGVNIYRHLGKRDELTKRFQKCGDTKVSYLDRDFLACLTAASLIDLSDKNGATAGCKEVYKNGKTKGRSNCLSSISQL
jgi:hypothetical protein